MLCISFSYSQCPSDCDACTGYYQCISCPPNTINNNGTCVTSCPPGTYYDSYDTACYPCDQSCSQCNTNDYDYCNVCAPGYFTDDLSFPSYCDDTCDAEDYILSTPSGQVCVSCAYSCATCLGESDTQCTSCSSSSYYNYFFITNANYTPGVNVGTCLDGCPTFYYPVLGSNGVYTCLQQSLIISSITCSPGEVSFNNTCASSCSSGTYNDGAGKCEICDQSCADCTGASNTQCTSCQSGYNYYYNSTSGVSYCLKAMTCPPGTYEDDGDCYSCSSGCANCFNYDYCWTFPLDISWIMEAVSALVIMVNTSIQLLVAVKAVFTNAKHALDQEAVNAQAVVLVISLLPQILALLDRLLAQQLNFITLQVNYAQIAIQAAQVAIILETQDV